MPSSIRPNVFASPKSISSQSVGFGDSYAVQRLAGVGWKLVMPSLTRSTRSYFDVNDADALGNGRPPALKARLPAGGGAGAIGGSPLPQASNSVSPVFAPRRCVNTARTRS